MYTVKYMESRIHCQLNRTAQAHNSGNNGPPKDDARRVNVVVANVIRHPAIGGLNSQLLYV